jgi:hypothetical protein
MVDSAENEKMKLHYISLITTTTDGLNVKTTHSEVRGESMEQCYEYTKKLHSGKIN